MAARRPFWKWRCWKSIGSCLWPPSTRIWNFKLKFQSELDLCSGNHVIYRQTDGRTDGRTEGRTAYDHHQHAYEILNWNSKANLTYAPETMSSTDGRTDRRTDGRTDGLWPPSTRIWNFKLKFQSELDLCSGNHVYRQMDGRTDL